MLDSLRHMTAREFTTSAMDSAKTCRYQFLVGFSS